MSYETLYLYISKQLFDELLWNPFWTLAAFEGHCDHCDMFYNPSDVRYKLLQYLIQKYVEKFKQEKPPLYEALEPGVNYYMPNSRFILDVQCAVKHLKNAYEKNVNKE